MSKKKFEVPDPELWEEVKASIAPIKASRRSKAGRVAAPYAMFIQPQSVEAPKPRTPRTIPPALATFERRTAQKLGRGQMEPEARIDLHGENLENARHQLLNFLSSRRLQGYRLVLVITGKGASQFARHTLHGMTHFHAPEREGKLRRELPMWLEDQQFRSHVVGFQPAHPKHGGGGAFYVKLRKITGEYA
jgi:DNA-nicking Smr family endonuclease